MGTLHCALENGAYFDTIALGLLKKGEGGQIAIFFTSRGAYVNLRCIASGGFRGGSMGAVAPPFSG